MVRVSPTRILFLALLLIPTSGCLFHSRKIERQVSNAVLQSATQEELIARFTDLLNA